jgi:hypothetical protein
MNHYGFDRIIQVFAAYLICKFRNSNILLEIVRTDTAISGIVSSRASNRGFIIDSHQSRLFLQLLGTLFTLTHFLLYIHRSCLEVLS